ncbi:MAG TPA: condensation domain-containing protein, partial [Thermoanaerobaculia bacterium]
LRVPRGQTFPLSFSQERMWFLNQLDPGTSAYNLSRALRLRGRLDLSVLGRVFSELVRRHETLRTSFALADGRPVQVVNPPLPVAPAIVDLRHLPPAAREGEARRRATAETVRPFDLSRDPLIRATLLRLADGEEGETENVLLLTVHHICTDGWSMGILIRELAALYRAYAAGERSPLPELPIQYVDFSTWQRTVLSGEVLEAEKAWWSARLAGTPPPLLLPADRRRSAVQGFQPAVGSLVLPADLAEGLRKLSRRQSASLYMTLLAGWKALLARLTGEEDLLLGAPIANRTRAEIEGLIGFFLNTLVLRTDLSGDPDFQAALSRVRETCLGAFSHQDLPLEQVLEAMHAGHGSSPFQVMFLLQNVPAQEIEIPGLNLSVLAAEQEAEELGTAIFEVGLTLVEQPDGILAAVTYNGLLFDEPTIQALLARYERLLAGAVADPARPFWDYPLLSTEEQRQLLAWNGAAASLPAAPEAVHRLFERRAAETPEALALIAGDRRLTYAGLSREANRLARHLRALGVGPEVVAGIAVERSPEMVIALLAVLKAGGAYVPLDPAYPAERLAYILEDAAAAVLVTTGRTLAALPGLAREGLRVVDLDADAGRIAARDGADLG